MQNGRADFYIHNTLYILVHKLHIPEHIIVLLYTLNHPTHTHSDVRYEKISESIGLRSLWRVELFQMRYVRT